jgi:hypothetical protein
MKGARRRFSLKHFKLKIIRRKSGFGIIQRPDSGYRSACCFNRNTICEAGSASGAMAVK